MIKSANIATAIHEIKPNSDFSVGETYSSLVWTEGQEQDKPTEKEFNDAVTAYDDKVYARNRKADYPDWGTQLNKIYDDGVDKWKTEMVDPVKAKWPKDNSGPK